MKLPIFLGLAASLLIAGCSGNTDKSATSTNTTATGSSPTDAPAGYLGALGKAQQTAVKTVDTASLNQAIQMFNVDKGRYPKLTLDELVQEKVIPKLPEAPYGSKIVYDAQAGKVKVVKE